MNFEAFAKVIRDRFDHLAKNKRLYRSSLSREDLWTIYLDAFPEGSNPMFRERREHDCVCCASFIKNIAGVVAITDAGELETIWDVEFDGPYGVVAKQLATWIRAHDINNIALFAEGKFGAESTVEAKPGKPSIVWRHFNCVIPKNFLNPNMGKALSDAASARAVLKRGLEEFDQSVLDTVRDLIVSNTLYRGEENLPALAGFIEIKKSYDACDPKLRDRFTWKHSDNPASRFRNTVIGTLCQDLAEGITLEAAVSRFEKKVAPENYKRPTALITPVMIDKALATLRELNLEDALPRRFATNSDLRINDIIFADRSVSPLMTDPLKDLLMGSVKRPKTARKVEVSEDNVIMAEEFFRDVIPGCESISVQLERDHLNNFMALTTAQNPQAGRLFKWDNPFAWCYDGNIADSDMRRAVIAKGGRVDGVLRFTQSWNHPGQRNASLMDTHVFIPGPHQTITDSNLTNDYYGSGPRVGWNIGAAEGKSRFEPKTQGIQDVDYTAAAPADYVPVENITFPDISRLPEGRYICKIHNWSFRDPTTGGFRAEIECGGQLFEYEYTKPMQNKEWVTVAVVTLRNGVFTVDHKIPASARSITKWGVTTGDLVQVNSVMLSPNHWGEKGTGNKHFLFFLQNCKNPNPTRGFFNEFLRSDLEPHRKVFEVLSAKTVCEPSDEQLAGLGFSSTRGDKATFVVKKDGAKRTYKVQF